MRVINQLRPDNLIGRKKSLKADSSTLTLSPHTRSLICAHTPFFVTRTSTTKGNKVRPLTAAAHKRKVEL